MFGRFFFVIAIIFLFAIIGNPLQAQKTLQTVNQQYRIAYSTEDFTIDGNLNELGWQKAAYLDAFFNKWPTDTGKAVNHTKVQLLYSATHIYVGITAFTSGKQVIQTLKRDGDNYWIGDGVMILFDAMNRRAQSLGFGINAGGAQIDGINQAGESMNFNWDAKWFSAVKQHANCYVAELMIPLKTFRFQPENTIWGMNVLRNDMSNNTYSSWTNVPIAFDGVDMGFFGTLQFENSLQPATSNHALIPFITNSTTQYGTNSGIVTNKVDAGLDAKIAVTPTLMMDVTLNPDFSQVDVDRQVINFDRFELFFPERRNFFLENSDLFANYGTNSIRPFFSRRIGIGNNGEQTPIIGGIRLSGNISKDGRLGLLSMLTEQTNKQAAQHISVGSVEHRILKRSNIRALFTHRQSLNSNNIKLPIQTANYNTVAGGEFNYTSANSKYMGNLRYFQSFNPGNLQQSGYMSGRVQYITQKWWLNLMFDEVGKNFITDVGFVPRLNNYDAAKDTTIRLGYKQIQANAQYRLYPQKGNISQDMFEIWPTITLNRNNSLNEISVYLRRMIAYKNSAFLETGIRATQINLPFATAFFPNTGHVAKGNYQYINALFYYYSDARKAFNYDGGIDAGSYFNGNRLIVNGAIRYRLQPKLQLGLSATHGWVTLNQQKATTLLVGPTAEINFSDNLFWTTFLQYNTQANNVNINSRFQWRFKPLSDLFVVYTDNYTTEKFINKNRMLVVKLNYWLNW